MVTTKFIIITGLPGVGKTTIVKRILQDLGTKFPPPKIQGFYTEECRDKQNCRKGFDIVAINSDTTAMTNRGILARTELSDITSVSYSERVGKYYVDLTDFERVAMPIICNSKFKGIFLIDEIGRMELLSKLFGAGVTDLINNKECFLIVTAPLKSSSVVQSMKQFKSAVVYEVTKSNRNSMYKHILKSAETMVQEMHGRLEI